MMLLVTRPFEVEKNIQCTIKIKTKGGMIEKKCIDRNEAYTYLKQMQDMIDVVSYAMIFG